MRLGSLFRCAIALGLLGFLSACEELETARQRTTTSLRAVIPFPTSAGYWAGDGVHGSPKIVIHLSEQRAYFYKGKKLVGESSVSTGKPGFSTPPGRYRVIQKDRNHISSEFGDYVDVRGSVVKSNIDVRNDPKPLATHFDGARMPYFMRFNGGYGMHAGYVPRYRASHGCIRLPAEMARRFFNAAREDTPVIVKE
jgi:lipoprotein-anchoring transpeptidase ErfK/SrfK